MGLVRNRLIAAFAIWVLMTLSKEMSPKRGVFFKTGLLLSNNLQIRTFDVSNEFNLSLEYTGLCRFSLQFTSTEKFQLVLKTMFEFLLL